MKFFNFAFKLCYVSPLVHNLSICASIGDTGVAYNLLHVCFCYVMLNKCVLDLYHFDDFISFCFIQGEGTWYQFD